MELNTAVYVLTQQVLDLSNLDVQLQNQANAVRYMWRK